MNALTSYTKDQFFVDIQGNKSDYKNIFETDALIQESVSFVYYPSQREFPLFGHAELEIDGKSWTVLHGRSSSKSLSNMIKLAQSGFGHPFFRVIFSVTPDQHRDLREKPKIIQGTCSMRTLKNLSKYGKYHIPLPIAVFPFTSFTYLVTAKALGSRRIKKIEFYGEHSALNNIAKCIKGVVFESLVIGSLFLLSFYTLILGMYTTCYLKNLYSKIKN